MTDRVADYDYHLPTELIAREPAEHRDASRLMVVDRQTQSCSHRTFHELVDLLNPGDVLVLNDTQVVPARLFGVRTATGGKWEGLFLREEQSGLWRVIGQTRGRLTVRETLTLHLPHRETAEEDEPLRLELLERQAGGEWIVRPSLPGETLELLQRYGSIPLPHYMEREAQSQDAERYQTTYARRPGAVAAPTAGLHFTPELLQALAVRGVQTARVTLHVGLGTFRPVAVERLSEHRMHAEWYDMPPETVSQIHQTKQNGGRVIAVGTTSVRTLESAARQGSLLAGSGETDLFIKPPYRFQVVDGLITNFHLPKSTLLVLVSTFAGRELMLQAYTTAIQERYRFYSYGDAMLIL